MKPDSELFKDYIDWANKGKPKITPKKEREITEGYRRYTLEHIHGSKFIEFAPAKYYEETLEEANKHLPAKAGRPRIYKEKTTVMRIPDSMVDEIKALISKHIIQ